MKNDKIRTIAYMAFYAALYVVLRVIGNMIPFLKMPNGGSIEIELVALFIASYHLGWLKGLGIAAVCLLLNFFTGNTYFLNPAQYALDYIVPLAVVGLASLWSTKTRARYVIGVVISMVLKYISQVLSGVFFWPPEGSAAGSGAAWVFSLSYNLWYNVASLAVCVILVPLLVSRLAKAAKTPFYR
jgi:thiamine transporter